MSATVTPLDVFRLYAPEECEGDARESGKGYPFAWKRLPLWDGHGNGLNASGEGLPVAAGGLKELVRDQAGHRCVRCGHPFVVGQSGVTESVPVDEVWERGEAAARQMLTLSESQFTMPDTGPTEPRTVTVNWSPCDERCTHAGPFRWREGGDEWQVDERVEGSVQAVWALEPGYEIEAAWRILTVHHLNEVKHDCRWWNLVALCQRCHLNVQRRVKMERAYPWEHSEWFLPYVAGFYAAKYRGWNLTREEVAARQEELLAIGRAEESVERMPC
jgi:5-methylcytosine-specific restriction endonuclease McrA